jgi:hypothetical protein
MPKTVNLGPTLSFPTIASAKAHFDPFRSGGDLDKDVSQEQLEQLKVLYETYCATTQYALPAAIVAFFPTMEKRSGGYTRCLCVRFADGTSTTFSLDKAISSVASSD